MIEKLAPPPEPEFPRWTLPKRTRMDEENLHISSFVLLKDGEGSVAFLRAGPKHPVPFKRGKLLLPAVILSFGENPRLVSQRVLGEQIAGAENLNATFVTLQSYLGAHWDIVFVYEAKIEDAAKKSLSPKEPYTEIKFLKLSSLPKKEIAEDHLEVLDGLAREQFEK